MKALYQAKLYQSKLPHDQIYHDYLIEESPLSLLVNQNPFAIFMRTPQHDLDLVCGFLWSEKIIEEINDLSYLTSCQQLPNQRVHAYLASGIPFKSQSRHSYISSSCGLCSLQDIQDLKYEAGQFSTTVKTNNSKLDEVDLWQLQQRMNSSLRSLTQSEIAIYLDDFEKNTHWFKQTGACHAAALYSPSSNQAKYVREDVGRHNAVDKVLGAALRNHETQLYSWVLVVSSRAGFEIIQKAVHVGVGAVITLGAASAMAHRYAIAQHLPLFSFAKKRHAHRHISNS
jgi:FdhD protein